MGGFPTSWGNLLILPNYMIKLPHRYINLYFTSGSFSVILVYLKDLMEMVVLIDDLISYILVEF